MTRLMTIGFLQDETACFYNTVIGPKDFDGTANSMGPDQTVPLIAVLANCSDVFVPILRMFTISIANSIPDLFKGGNKALLFLFSNI